MNNLISSLSKCYLSLPQLATICLLLISVSSCGWPTAPAGNTEYSSGQGELDCEYDISPDAHLVVLSGTGNGIKDLYLLDLRTNKVTQLTNTPAYEACPAFSPDGKSVIYQCAKDLNSSRYLYIRSQSERQISEHMPPWYNLFINTVVDFS